MSSEIRQEALDLFAHYTGIEGLIRLVQRGRDPLTARFVFEMSDGARVRVGSIDKLWSQAEIGKSLAVAIGRVPLPVKTSEWRQLVAVLVRHATDIEEAPDQALADRLLDWLDQYITGAATTDRDGAVQRREPFVEDGDLWVHAGHLARWVRREYSEQVSDVDVRGALADLGFAAARVTFNETGTGKTRKRTTARYRRGPLDIMEGDRD